MRQGLWSKILAFIGIEEEWENEEAAASEVDTTETGPRSRRGALVSLPGGRTFRVIVARPREFDEVQVMADQLKAGRPVVLNLEDTPREARSRIINFLTGVIYALDGQMRRVGGGILLFAPHNVDVEYSGQIDDIPEGDDADTI